MDSVCFERLAKMSKLTNEDIAWYAELDTPSVENINPVKEHVLGKNNTKHSFGGSDVPQKKMKTSTNWTMEVGVEQGIHIPIYKKARFPRNTHFGHHHNEHKFLFNGQPLMQVSCNIGTVRIRKISQETNILNHKKKYGDYTKVKQEVKEIPISHSNDLMESYPLWVFDCRAEKYNLTGELIRLYLILEQK